MGRHTHYKLAALVLGLAMIAGPAVAEEWTTAVTVENGIGQTITLEYGIHPTGTDGVDAALGEVGLPPWPPTAVFEARFHIDGVEGLALDIRDDSTTERTHEIRWQAGGGGYPVILRWDASTLPPATFTMQDGYTGTLIPPFDMAQTDSLVVPAIQSYITRINITVLPGELPPGPPIITPEIPDQTVFMGQQFVDLDLDDYVADPDNAFEDLEWILTGDGPPWLTLGLDRTLTIEAPDGWTGIADFNLRVTDPGGLQDDQDFRLTVLQPGLPSWIVALNVENGIGELESLGVGIHTDATDGIDPDLDEVALPPWPPSDVFDARCELPDAVTHSRLDLRTSGGGDPSYHLVWQTGIGGYPVTVTWPAELPLGGFIIRDDLGGAFLPPLDMSTTQTLVVPDSLSFITGLVIEATPLVDTLAPVGPAGLDVTDWLAWDWVILDWSSYPCTEENFAYYEILFDTDLFTTVAYHSWDWSEDGALASIGTTTTTVLLPAPADGYVFRIRAWDAFGNAGPLSDYCYVGGVTGAPTPTLDGTLLQASACTPNPFNPNTVIYLELERDTEIRAEVFDSRGQRVRLLLQEPLTAGAHSLAWDGRGDQGESLASGFYLCRITGGGESLNRKMILLK
jgi:hypothetical protein